MTNVFELQEIEYKMAYTESDESNIVLDLIFIRLYLGSMAGSTPSSNRPHPPTSRGLQRLHLGPKFPKQILIQSQ